MPSILDWSFCPHSRNTYECQFEFWNDSVSFAWKCFVFTTFEWLVRVLYTTLKAYAETIGIAELMRLSITNKFLYFYWNIEMFPLHKILPRQHLHNQW